MKILYQRGSTARTSTGYDHNRKTLGTPEGANRSHTRHCRIRCGIRSIDRTFSSMRSEYRPLSAVAISPRTAAQRGGSRYKLQKTEAIEQRKTAPVFLFAADHRNPLSARTTEYVSNPWKRLD